MVDFGLDKGADLTVEGGTIGRIGTNLYQLGSTFGIDGVEIDLVPIGRAEVMHLAVPAEQFDEDGGFKSMA